MLDDNPNLATHNQSQMAYFEATTKYTMLPGFTPYIQRQADRLLEFAGVQPGDRVLEVGCGMGRHTFYLAEKGIQVEGLDLTPGLLEKLQQFDGGRYNIPIHCGDVLDLSTSLSGQYDAVIGFFVLHHLFDLPEAFQSMAQLVKPGGRLGFVEPNPYNPLYYLQIALTPGMLWTAERGMLKMRRGVIFSSMQSAGLRNPVSKRFGFFPRFVTNRKWGTSLETLFERITFISPVRPFVFFGAER